MTAPPPPPAPPPLPAPWSIRSARAGGEDLDRIHAWMRRPHVARRWHRDWPRERWRRCLAEQLGGDRSRPCLVSHHARPVGYVEIYRVQRDTLAAHYDHDPHDLGLHVALGEPDGVGRGRGTQLLRLLGEALLAREPACRRVVLEPDVANEPMHRALAKAGYRAVGPVDLGHKRALLTVLERAGVPAVERAHLGAG